MLWLGMFYLKCLKQDKIPLPLQSYPNHLTALRFQDSAVLRSGSPACALSHARRPRGRDAGIVSWFMCGWGRREEPARPQKRGGSFSAGKEPMGSSQSGMRGT